MSDSVSHLLRTVAAECEELQLNFVLHSDWENVLSHSPLYFFGWEIKSGLPGESACGYPYESLEDCLSACVGHTKHIREKRSESC